MSSRPHDPYATATKGNGKKVTLDQVLTGKWASRQHGISWIEGADGEDGLLLQRGGEAGRDYLVVEDVRYLNDATQQKANRKTLMQTGGFHVGSEYVVPAEVWPSPDHKHVLILSLIHI